MYLHLSNIGLSLHFFIFELLFDNLTGSKKHKIKVLNRGKRKTLRNANQRNRNTRVTWRQREERHRGIIHQ